MIPIVKSESVLDEIAYLIRADYTDPHTGIDYVVRVVPSDVRLIFTLPQHRNPTDRDVFFLLDEQNVHARAALAARIAKAGGNVDENAFVGGVLPGGVIQWR